MSNRDSQINTSADPSDQCDESNLSLQPSSLKSFDDHVFVYIPDLAYNLPEQDVEQMIQNEIAIQQRMSVKNVKCHRKLGIAVIQLMTDEDRRRLINDVGSIMLEASTTSILSFVDTIEHQIILVLDETSSKVYTKDEIIHFYKQTLKLEEIHHVEPISAQFPYIFRIILANLDDLIKVIEQSNVILEDTSATIYPYADYCFLTDIPANIDQDKIKSAIIDQLGLEDAPTNYIYVNHNKQSGNAIVLVNKSIRKWMKESLLTIDGQELPKKDKLAYRIYVSPVPKNFDINLILQHKRFRNSVIDHTHTDDNLILDLANSDSYNDYLESGPLRINDHSFEITAHVVNDNSNQNEINAETWYEKRMLEIEPNILPLMNRLDHPIFRWHWDPQSWLEQMNKIAGAERGIGRYDLQRHLLRVTVMLNTIGADRNAKYEVDGETIILKPVKLTTIFYDHASKLSLGKKLNRTEVTTPFNSTSISVVNQDCLVLYEELVAKGYNPVLLNMASATSPGGGYRKGDGAQEENLFRRSNYYHSLDLEIADKHRSERFYYTSESTLISQNSSDPLYPMPKFGAIYTSGITVFRGTESDGYPYMKNPLYDVCAIAMAASRDPALTSAKMLEDKIAMNTRKKMENIFAIAHHHRHDCLVLSAFGCGAFKNPPKHIALLFKSVIHQYAGCFKKVYFAIIDDHNTGNKFNPDGNFLPFQEILDNLEVHPPKTIRKNISVGPYRILEYASNEEITLSDVCIQNGLPCEYGSACRKRKDAEHSRNYSHPTMCPFQDPSITSCDQMEDDVHKLLFIHRAECQYGGECASKDPQHLEENEHPEFCKDGSRCENMMPKHLFTFRHLPNCPKGIKCLEYMKGNKNHCLEFRHCKSICTYDNNCVSFHDKEHVETTIHTFRKPCPFTPYHCPKFVQFIQTPEGVEPAQDVMIHCYTYSHVCPFGRRCKTQDSKHYEIAIHIARNMCPDDGRCEQMTDEDHLESFTHTNIRDIRLFCRYPGHSCSDRFKNQHLKKYRHGKNHNQLGVSPYAGVNNLINFVDNQKYLIRTVNKYATDSSWKKSEISQEILDWIRALQPVHRCNREIFESILVHGHVMSREYMKMLRQPKHVAKAVMQHSRIRVIFLEHNSSTVKENTQRLIEMLVNAEFAEAGVSGAPPKDPDFNKEVFVIEKKLKPPLKDQDVRAIHEWAKKIAQASIRLHATPTGIGYHVDTLMGTDKQVFSILGPHYGHYYGDIIVVFKQEIMFHVDTNFAIQAATYFGPSGHAYEQRPWLKDPGNEAKRVEDYHKSKLHCSIPKFEHAAATELIGLTGMKKKTLNVNLKSIIERWTEVDSHDVFESHLPQLIPLNYVDRIYMPKNIFEALMPASQNSARAAFKDALIITQHKLDLSLTSSPHSHELDATRKPYQKYVIEEIMKSIKDRMKKQSIPRGFTMTLSSSKFEEHVLIPLSISDSYKLYRLDKETAPNTPEFTYIYWQAMVGDMMISISNERIKPTENQPSLRCLICYVAEKPSTNDDDEYHEKYSYLNDSSPYAHHNNMEKGSLRAKSKSLYRGCNTDDFLTFCLKISHKKNKATLKHAGPNGLYNHEKISLEFDKAQLDLSRLYYVHMSAGNQDVPVRNLTINHEPIAAMHVSFDKDFKIDTSSALENRRQSVEYVPSTIQHPPEKTITSNPTKTEEKSRNQNPASHVEKPSAPVVKRSFFGKLLSAIVGPSIEEKPPKTATTTPKNPYTVTTSKLKPCQYSIYCLEQSSKIHIEQFSHPCRFNELCRDQNSEPHLVHTQHNVPKCSEDVNCSEKINPIHRAQFRHTNLPDFLYPCRNQESCRDESETHRIKYSHGEELPSIRKPKMVASTTFTKTSTMGRYPCRYGDKCRLMRDSAHMAKYSHPS